MPVRRKSCSVAPALALLLAGCAVPAADKFTPNPGGAAASTAAVTASAAAMRAFGHLCGRLEADEVQRRAGAYGFAAMDPRRLPQGALSEVVRGGGARVMARPGGTPALLIWTDAGPSCELAVGGIDAAALVGEFDAMLRAFEQRPEVTVNSVPPPADQSGALRLQRVVVLAPRALVPMPPRTMALRTAAPGTPGIQAVMTARVMSPGAAPTPPPPGPGAPKD